MKGRVLITTGLQRKTLAAATNLKKRGLEVTVGDSSILAPALWSKYCDKRLIYPSSRYKPIEFVDCLLAEVKKTKYDLLLPASEAEIYLVSKYKHEFEEYTNVAAVDFDLLMLARDKAETMKAAMNCGIPCPHTYIFETLEQLEEIKDDIEPPVVIKPRIASGGRGLAIVHDKTKIVSEYHKTHINYPFPIIQEYIPSNEYGSVTNCILDKSGKLITAFSYRRIREFPVKAGASTFVESVRRPEQEEIAYRFLKSIGWYGLGMLEFRIDSRDGKPKIIELNERLNASTKLSILSGVEIPFLLYQLFVHSEVEPVTEYKVGMRCRWLWPGDVLHFLTNPDRFRLETSFFHFFDKDTRYEFLNLDDPLPAIAWTLWMLSNLFNVTILKDFIFRRYSKR